MNVKSSLFRYSRAERTNDANTPMSCTEPKITTVKTSVTYDNNDVTKQLPTAGGISFGDYINLVMTGDSTSRSEDAYIYITELDQASDERTESNIYEYLSITD